METTPIVPAQKLEPGVYQGTPDDFRIRDADLVTKRLMRTMSNDIAEAVKKQNETAVSIAIAEEKKMERERAAPTKAGWAQDTAIPPAPRRIGRVFIVLGVVLIIIAMILAYIFVLPRIRSIKMPTMPTSTPDKLKTNVVAPVVTQAVPPAPSLIAAQSEKRFDISKETLAKISSAIAAEREKGNTSSSVKNLYLTESTVAESGSIPAGRLLSFVGTQIPEIIIRSIEKPFMAGFFGEKNGGATPFLILKISAYDTGLAGMLEWETELPHFFNRLFGVPEDTGTTSLAKFHDIVVSGKDTRLLEMSPGVSISYAFANPRTIVITGSHTTLEALLPLAAKI